MTLFVKRLEEISLRILTRTVSSNSKPVKLAKKSYDLVIIGAGAGGLAVASRFARYFNSTKKSIAIIEPRDVHYYQPLWTLVGAGLKELADSSRPMAQVIPKEIDWIKESCSEIYPMSNKLVLTGASGSIDYKYLVVAAGINIDWHKIDGLLDCLRKPNSGVCSNYSEKTVLSTWTTLQHFHGGHAIFTLPNTPIKCAGAPQKIMYLSDAYFTKKGIRSKTQISYFTSLPTIFSVKHYANVLEKVCNSRNININLRKNLVRIDGEKKIAYFQYLDEPNKPMIEVKYDMLHVTPPMSAPKFLQPLATDSSNGFVAVDPKTLQHVTYKNVFSLGDCSSLPTSKTAAAIASQNYILAANLMQVMQNDTTILKDANLKFNYDGYTSCPIVTGFDHCIMAEFNYKLEPLETFPFDQSKERKSMYYAKKDLLPLLYWNGLIRGYWSGPSIFRKIFHFGLQN